MENSSISLDTQLEKLEQILKDKPEDPSSLMALGEMALRRGRNLVALSSFQRLAELKPNLLEVHLSLSKIYAAQKMYGEAYRELVDVFQRDPKSVEGRVFYKVLAQECTPPDEVKAVLHESLNLPVSTEDVALYLQQLAIEQARLSKDVRELSNLLERSPMETILEYDRNMAMRKLKDIEELKEIAKGLSSASPTTNAPPAMELQSEPSVVFDQTIVPMLQLLAKTKGVEAVFALDGTGKVVEKVDHGAIDLAPIVSSLWEGIQVLCNISPELIYWVIEFHKGLLVVQKITDQLFIGIVTDATTSFGALHYVLEKNRK